MLKHAVLAAAALVAGRPASADTAPRWAETLAKARGQTVYWNAWGGSEQINAYIAWVGKTVADRFGMTVVHVKLDDTAKAVSSVLAEKSAGKETGGSVDLIWINGENFAAMKQQGMLFGPDWVSGLPNIRYVDFDTRVTAKTDFTVPTDGLESPWGAAKLVFFHDTARTPAAGMPDSAKELLAWSKAHPGLFSYPQPPDFIGSTFLKQVLIENVADKARLLAPVRETTFEQDVAPLFAYLDQLHPSLWRRGRAFPKNYPDMKQKLADGELEIIFAFNPAEASLAIASGELPDSVRSFVFSAGTLGNTHFVAIPYNATAKEGAMVVADFLLSPEAQARKQDPHVWGDPTVLSMARLDASGRAAFAKLDLGVATLQPDQLGPQLDEPHPSWMTRIEAEWTRRYGAAN